MKRTITLILVLILCVICFIGCSQKDELTLSISPNDFECERLLSIYNTRSDRVILTCEGYMSISIDSSNTLTVTFKVGPYEYITNYIRLNEWVIYVAEDITGTHTDPYHYKIYYHDNESDLLPDSEGIPDIEIIPI